MTHLKRFLGIIAATSLMIAMVPYVKADGGLKVMDTTAGKPALLMVSGKPFEVVELEISNPFLSTVRQKFQLNDKGILQYWYPEARMAGSYAVKYKGEKSVFVVSAGDPSPEKSTFSLEDYTGFVNEPISGNIVLQDPFGNRLAGKALQIATKGSAQVKCSRNCRTNDQGELSFQVVSQKIGLKKILVTDSETGIKLFSEDVGFIPVSKKISRRTPEYSFEYDEEELPYVPVMDSLKATRDSRGNDDRFRETFNDDSLWDFLKADLVDAPTKIIDSPELMNEAETLLAQNTIASATGFEIIQGTDFDKKYEKEETVKANSALDFIVKAVDQNGKIVKTYDKTVVFEISPKGPVLPENYTFSPIDQGKALFELSLVLPTGDYTFSVKEKNNTSVVGELKIHAQSMGLPNFNNTNIVLNLESPVMNGKYSKSVNVGGTVNTENTEIIVKETGTELKRSKVNAEKIFQIPLDLQDGKHSLEITAVYLVDGSQTKTTVDLEVDRTPPVIIKAPSDIPPARANQPFTLTAEAEEGSTLKAFINNRAYEFVGNGTSYALTATAPLDPGEFPITLQISDAFGNVTSQDRVAVIKILEALKEIKNLYGIPGMGTITLAWDPVPDASTYEVLSKSILGTSEPFSAQKTTLTLDQLSSDVAYTFVVVAKNSQGTAVSLPTETKTISPLAVVGKTEKTPHPAANLPELPSRQPGSGPEVYVLVLLTVVIMHGYSRYRRKAVEMN